jgi:hypothetical protein
MKKLLLALLLISPASFADWGDVYYCQMTNFVAISEDGKTDTYPLERFKFTLDDREMGAVLFGKGGYLGGEYVPVERDTWRPEVPSWAASDSLSRLTFREGKLMYMDNFMDEQGVRVISADCDKF